LNVINGLTSSLNNSIKQGILKKSIDGANNIYLYVSSCEKIIFVSIKFFLRLRDRGMLGEGMNADITIFDPKKIGDRANLIELQINMLME